MPRNDPLLAGGTGRLAFGPADEDRLVLRTLEFVCQQLAAWRDDPLRPKNSSERESNEKDLNWSLCNFLDVKSRAHLPMARFTHEVPQSPRRTVDIGVHGLDQPTTIDTRSYGRDDPFLVIECKRLPSPGGKGREREYMSGFANGSPTGGIQRFKLSMHGGQVEVAAIVGYIEKHNAPYWHKKINLWLVDLVNNPSRDRVEWSSSESLQQLMYDADNTGWCDSRHPRIGDSITPEIRLRHLWVQMS